MFAAFTMGLAIKSYFEFNNQLISRELKSNWAWSLLFLVLSNIGYAIGAMGFRWIELGGVKFCHEKFLDTQKRFYKSLQL